MRLFIAIQFSQQIKEELKRFQKELKQNGGIYQKIYETQSGSLEVTV